MLNFDTFIGNRKIVDILRRFVSDVRRPEVLLYVGPAHVGKHSLAEVYVRALHCTQRDVHTNPCGECVSCRFFIQGHQPDHFFLRKLDDKTQISVEQVRELRGALRTSPFFGGVKTVIIENAELLNEEAANALLKTIEDVPKNTFFILITQYPDRLISTIRSRSMTFIFQLCGQEELSSITHNTLSPFLMMLSQGRPGFLLEYVHNKDVQERYAHAYEHIKEIVSSDFSHASGAFEECFKKELYGFGRDEWLRLWAVFLATQNQLYTLDVARTLIQAGDLLHRNVSPRLIFENLFLAIKKEDV